ncbi:hypothetical protein Tco_1055649 [Tanacetum coccineum]|uniref:RNA-directed DNA polymerase, eukaryota n=1 Tax=Tanacetum coccineum TaxID=301880 RepID=A0ABQ5H288_9ASTR
MTRASSADKQSKTFDELMRTNIDFSTYIMNGLKITNLTQETLLGTTFRLLKGTRSNYVELEYDVEECYKALSKKLDGENPEGETDDQLVSRYIGGLRVQIMDSINMFDLVTLSDAYQRALCFGKQNRWVGDSSSTAITAGSSGSVPMDAYHLLLGRTWEYDRNKTHDQRANTYSFMFGSVKITLTPNKPKELVNKPTGTLLTLSHLEDELEMGDEVHKVVHDNLIRSNTVYKKMQIKSNNMWILKWVTFCGLFNYGPFPGCHIRCSDVFNVKHLLPYHGDSFDDDIVGFALIILFLAVFAKNLLIIGIRLNQRLLEESTLHGKEASKKHNDTGTNGFNKNLNVVINNDNTTVLVNPFDVLNIVVNEEDVTPSSVLDTTVAKDGSNPENNKASDLGAKESDSEVEEARSGMTERPRFVLTGKYMLSRDTDDGVDLYLIKCPVRVIVVTCIFQEKSKDVGKSDPSFPPGFTPKGVNETIEEEENVSVNKSNSNHHCNKKTGSNGKCGSNRSFKLKVGGSILDVMEDLIEIGHAMGYNMEGCSKNIEAIVDLQGVTL